MMNMHRFSILLHMLVVGTLLGTTSWTGDFSVDLKHLVEIDAARPMPEYKLKRVLTRSEGEPDSDMPEKRFDVFINFTEFGIVRLDAFGQSGPSSGKYWEKGMTFEYGLADLKDVKVAWIKNSPDLFIVAWVDEPDMRGTGHNYYHGYTIVQLRHRRGHVLLRGQCAINAKNRGGIRDDVMDYSRFSFDAKEGLLQQQLTRSYEKSFDSTSHDLARQWEDKEGEDIFVASINETITLGYKLADGKLQPSKGSLVYHAQKQDGLDEVARFYLGPFAPRSVLLEANANLAVKYKGTHPGARIYLDEGTEIRVPVPEKWLIDSFGRTDVESRR